MEVIIVDSSEQVAEQAAATVCQLLQGKPDAVLGLATGDTPVSMYKRLVDHYRAGEISLGDVVTFNLDEYLGLEPGHPLSYGHFMGEQFFNHVDIQPGNCHLPECAPGEDPRAVGPAYEAEIAACGGIDLQVLGIGRNGHIGFNEPGSSLGSHTRVKTLHWRTLEDNARMFKAEEFQPQVAITMGIATIMDAERIMLLATDELKADAIRAMVEGPIAAMHPASVLQQHRRCRVILDEAAASKLELADYYRWVNQHTESIAAEHGGSGGSDYWIS